MAITLLKFKAGAIVPKSAIIAVAFLNAAHVLEVDAVLWVTSGRDGKHMTGSKHYHDEALDFRTKGLKLATKHALRAATLKRLGADYQAILEDLGGVNEHLHIEYDPPKGKA